MLGLESYRLDLDVASQEYIIIFTVGGKGDTGRDYMVIGRRDKTLEKELVTGVLVRSLAIFNNHSVLIIHYRRVQQVPEVMREVVRIG